MKQKLRVFLTLLLCAVASVGWAEEVEVTFDFSDQNNFTVSSGGTSGGGSSSAVDISCGDISITSPNGYNNVSSSRLHIYTSSTLAISTSSGSITKIVITSTAFK